MREGAGEANEASASNWIIVVAIRIIIIISAF
jgi:hypothetical protein